MADRTEKIKAICAALGWGYLSRGAPGDEEISVSGTGILKFFKFSYNNKMEMAYFIALCICELAKYGWNDTTACTEFIEYESTDLESTQSAQLAAIAQACAWIKKAGE